MKGIKCITLMIMSLSFLSGCSIASQPAETVPSTSLAENEQVEGTVTAGGDEELVDATMGGEDEAYTSAAVSAEDDEVTDGATEGEEGTFSESADETNGSELDETAESLAVGSIEKEFMLRTLWGKMLKEIDATSASIEDNNDWNRTYEVEAYLRNFTMDEFEYGIELVYPETAMVSYVYYWPDYIQNVRECYREADTKLQVAYDGKLEYELAIKNSYISKALDESVLQVTGQVINESYADADIFIEGIRPYTAYAMWGSVLEVAGQLYQENSGTILGELAGKAVMTNFDVETLTGTYWICLDDAEPVQAVLKFANYDCVKYTLDVNEAAVFDASELEQGWMGLEFDLFTTQTNK